MARVWKVQQGPSFYEEADGRLQVFIVFDIIARRLLYQLVQLPVRQILYLVTQTAALLLSQHGLL